MGSTEAFLNDIGTELLLRQLWDLALEGVAKRVGEARFLEINNILKDVISKRILHQVKSTICDLAYELGFLDTSGMIDTALQNATTMTMSSDCNAIVANSIENELLALARNLLQLEVGYT